jgi:hypothetical protein
MLLKNHWFELALKCDTSMGLRGYGETLRSGDTRASVKYAPPRPLLLRAR